MSLRDYCLLIVLCVAPTAAFADAIEPVTLVVRQHDMAVMVEPVPGPRFSYRVGFEKVADLPTPRLLADDMHPEYAHVIERMATRRRGKMSAWADQDIAFITHSVHWPGDPVAVIARSLNRVSKTVSILHLTSGQTASLGRLSGDPFTQHAFLSRLHLAAQADMDGARARAGAVVDVLAPRPTFSEAQAKQAAVAMSRAYRLEQGDEPYYYVTHRRDGWIDDVRVYIGTDRWVAVPDRFFIDGPLYPRPSVVDAASEQRAAVAMLREWGALEPGQERPYHVRVTNGIRVLYVQVRKRWEGVANRYYYYPPPAPR